jgi:hypothetical protein
MTNEKSSVMDSIFRAVAIGTLGGFICYSIGIPAPWLAGSLVATIVGIYTDQKLDLPESLRTAAFILLGVQTGTAVNADTVARAAQWPLSILCLAVTVALIVWACTLYYTRLRDWDQPTALFASLPGALSLVMLLAVSSGADMRRVTIAQCVRLFFLIAALPAVIRIISPLHATGNPAGVMGSVWEIAILVVASAIAGLFFARLRVPAGLILGASLMSAGLGLTGVVHGAAPNSILIPANVILGVMIGLRFKGIALAELLAAFGDGFAGFAIAMVIAIAGAAFTSTVSDLPLALTLLAFAPGGLEAMTIMAFALNLDPAYVAAHQVARYVGMVLLMPAVTAYVLNRGISIDKNLSVEQD